MVEPKANAGDEQATERDASDRIEAGLAAARPGRQAALARKAGLARVLSSVVPERAAATKVGRFELGERLGQGGMGVVYRAWDPELDRAVAIKLLRSSARDDAAKVLSEARALAQLSHPNVVTIYDVGEADGQPYIAMELVVGHSLRRWLEAHPDASWPRRIDLLAAAARGLAAAHEAGLVHMDFKLDNVLVGDDGRVRVVDFGLAHMTRDDGDGPRQVAGTPKYMAPEVAARQPATPLSDQYSFCRSIALDLTGIPRGVQALIDRGMRDNPADRWASMAVLVDELAAVGGTTTRDHVQQALLDRVESVWVDGVLSNALDGSDPVALPLEPVPHLVDAPFDGVPAAHPHAHDTRGLVDELERATTSLLVLGPPGAGKSITLLLLTRELLIRARARDTHPVPVVLNLSSFSPAAGLEKWLRHEIASKYSVPRRRVTRWLREHELLLLLDGLDEVADSRRAACISAINAYVEAFGVPVIVACREEAYAAAGVRLRVDAAVRIGRLGDDVVAGYLDTRGRAGASLRAALGEAAELRELMRSPLWLSLCTKAGIKSPSRGDSATWPEIYRQYIDHVFDARRGSTGERDRLLAALRWLARAMRRRGSSELWLERMQADWFPRAADAWVVTTIGMLVAMGIVLAINVLAGGFGAGGYATGFGVGIGAVVTTLAVSRTVEVEPREALRFSPRLAIVRAPLTVTLITAVAALFGWSIGDIWPNVVGGVVGGFVGAAVRGLEPTDDVTRIRTNQGIHQSALNALVWGGIVFAFSFVLFYFGVVPWSVWVVGQDISAFPPWYALTRSLSAATFGGSVTAMIHGGLAVILHGNIRLFLAAKTPVPLGLPAVLDRAVDLALLRKVGGGYIFYHRTMMEYLADSEVGPRA